MSKESGPSVKLAGRNVCLDVFDSYSFVLVCLYGVFAMMISRSYYKLYAVCIYRPFIIAYIKNIEPYEALS